MVVFFFYSNSVLFVLPLFTASRDKGLKKHLEQPDVILTY